MTCFKIVKYKYLCTWASPTFIWWIGSLVLDGVSNINPSSGFCHIQSSLYDFYLGHIFCVEVPWMGASADRLGSFITLWYCYSCLGQGVWHHPLQPIKAHRTAWNVPGAHITWYNLWSCCSRMDFFWLPDQRRRSEVLSKSNSYSLWMADVVGTVIALYWLRNWDK